MQKLSLSLIVIVVLAVVVLGWGISQYYANYVDREFDQHDPMFQAYEQLGRTLALTLRDKHDREEFVRAWGNDETLVLFLVQENELVLPETLKVRLAEGDSVTLESERYLSFYFSVKGSDQTLVLEAEKPPVVDESMLRLILTLSFYLGVIVVILLWLYPLITRLMRLRKTAIEFGAGNLAARLGLSRYSYISDIEREFNRMADRIRSLVDDNKLLSRAVSHDLKTPLARLRFGFETLAESKNDVQREKYHKRIEADLQEMETLVETLLRYARLDEAVITLTQSSVDLSLLVKQCSEKLTSDKDISIASHGDCFLVGDARYLTMLIQNLLVNAIEHSDRRIDVTAESTSAGVTLVVEDDGDGIAPEQRDLIIKPFVKGDKTKKTGKNGHGMGLAIVHRVAEWHGATLRIDTSVALKGARFSLFFPRQ